MSERPVIMISDLHFDMVCRIFGYLRWEERIRLRIVCKDFYRALCYHSNQRKKLIEILEKHRHRYLRRETDFVERRETRKIKIFRKIGLCFSISSFCVCIIPVLFCALVLLLCFPAIIFLAVDILFDVDVIVVYSNILPLLNHWNDHDSSKFRQLNFTVNEVGLGYDYLGNISSVGFDYEIKRIDNTFQTNTLFLSKIEESYYEISVDFNQSDPFYPSFLRVNISVNNYHTNTFTTITTDELFEEHLGTKTPEFKNNNNLDFLSSVCVHLNYKSLRFDSIVRTRSTYNDENGNTFPGCFHPLPVVKLFDKSGWKNKDCHKYNDLSFFEYTHDDQMNRFKLNLTIKSTIDPKFLYDRNFVNNFFVYDQVGIFVFFVVAIIFPFLCFSSACVFVIFCFSCVCVCNCVFQTIKIFKIKKLEYLSRRVRTYDKNEKTALILNTDADYDY